jgi:hypothetical protein
MTTYTHTGYRPHVGYEHCGARLWGHTMPQPGKTHALFGGPHQFTALCGATVHLHTHDPQTEYPIPPDRRNVRPVESPNPLPVECRRCKRLLGRS